MAERLTQRFHETDRYAAYLRTTEGRLRFDLGWANLRPFLANVTQGRRVLDVAGGTGIFAIHLAELGFEVDMLDDCEPMLVLAADEAGIRGLGSRISFRLGDAACLPDLFPPSSFDVVICHNLLEYVEDPLDVLRGLTHALKKDRESVVSLLVRNRYGEVLKAAIKAKDGHQAKAALTAETVLDSLYGVPIRLFDPAGVRMLVEEAGLEVVADYGVRVVSDYMGGEELADEAYRRLVDLELLLGAQPQFAAVARYTQVIARASREPSFQRPE